PSKIGEIITLTLEVERIGNSSLALMAQCVLDGQTRVRALLTLCVFSLETRRAEPIPDDLRQRISDFQQGKLEHPWRKA
ncbi:MAG: hypothetical protein RQ826_10695, partial [Xanthomonadales bacterium]|nr:hypothetical protein [Xanthomonadales bacterium]